MTQESHIWTSTQKLKNISLQRYRHCFVHCNIIHGGQDTQTPKVAIDRGLDREDVAHVYY